MWTLFFISLESVWFYIMQDIVHSLVTNFCYFFLLTYTLQTHGGVRQIRIGHWHCSFGLLSLVCFQNSRFAENWITFILKFNDKHLIKTWLTLNTFFRNLYSLIFCYFKNISLLCIRIFINCFLNLFFSGYTNEGEERVFQVNTKNSQKPN